MSTYIYLCNETKKEIVYYDKLVRYHSIKYNEAVHMALINYMYKNKGDMCTFITDDYPDWDFGCTVIDLSKYHFDDNIDRLIKEKSLKEPKTI